MFKNTKGLLNEYERFFKVPAFDLSVYYQGKEVYRDFRGVSDENGTPLNGKELYNMYSASKPITCAAALLLVQEGKIALNDDVASYLPAFKDVRIAKEGGLVKAGTPMKIEHLFTMTSGMSYTTSGAEVEEGIRDTEGKCATVAMMDYLAKIPLAFEPGESWRYSLCHDVLAAIVEVVSGKRFGLFVKERIFDPLGMKSSTFLLPAKELGKVCAQYRYFEDRGYVNVGKEIQDFKFGSEYESGGAGLVSTVEDYIQFLEGLRLGKILNAETRALMQKDMLTETQRPACWVAGGYGYGLGVRVPKAGLNLRTDYGWGGAAGAYVALDEKNEISISYAQHVLTSKNSGLNAGLIEAVKLDLGLDGDESAVWRGDGSHLA